MTPQFSMAVDPIFLHMLRLLERIGAGQEPSAKEERVRIAALIAEADARLGAHAEWMFAKYGLVSWIDEMLVEAPWNGKEWWSNNVLEMELFNSRNCYESFFVKAQEASTLSQRDALEVFYVCVILGFRGLYDDPELARPAIQAYELPEDLDTWSHQTALAIRLGQGRPMLQGIRRNLSGAPPRLPREKLIWPWLLAAISCSVAALTYAL
ncbi:DotU family type IV/VI secretion system protein [Aporhodopirellula aestuarii]|uniref:DotU family type IV/VI secretion system protein n=1 Tax=Aporhodopirellula aestuarii TaxID=2950107 RepID=A0ABT0TZ85_9BACT|nr:DotU family type IV/VI secretion system protein [Aporhodopirellula aestuarii]MCM2369885.1 DotU family type IV/VI secretion system protein [Aporhodopirellula aestuarii]